LQGFHILREGFQVPFCTECGYQHDGANFCPECGHPQPGTSPRGATQATGETTPPPQEPPETAVWEGESKGMANRVSGGSLVTARYRLTDRMLYFREGVATSRTEQVPLWAIRDIDVSEGFLQKRWGIGTVVVHVQHSDYTGRSNVYLEDIEEPGKVAQLINEHAQQAHLKYQQRQQTRYFGR
jgi:hypothetical protein